MLSGDFYGGHSGTILDQVFTFGTATIDDQIVYKIYTPRPPGYPRNDEFNILNSFFTTGAYTWGDLQPEIKLALVGSSFYDEFIPTRNVFEPKQGRDLIVLNPEYEDNNY